MTAPNIWFSVEIAIKLLNVCVEVFEKENIEVGISPYRCINKKLGKCPCALENDPEM